MRHIEVISPSIAVQSMTVFDPDQLAEAVGSSELMHTQFTGGDFRGSLLAVEFTSLRLDTGCYSQSLISRGAFPAGRIVIGCLLDAKQSGCLNGHRFSRHDIVIFPKAPNLTICCRQTPAGSQYRSRVMNSRARCRRDCRRTGLR